MIPINGTDLKSAICGLTEVEETTQGFEVTLPQVYHNGQSAVVMVGIDHDSFIVHDNSYAAMLLSNAGLIPGKKLADALQPQIAAYGCDLDGLRVFRRCASVADLGLAMMLVGCASRLLADQALKADRAPLYDFKSSLLSRVVDLVGAKRVRTNEEINGHLGSKYRVSAMILDTDARKPLAFVEPIPDREAIARRFKLFYDLARTPVYADIARVAVYDEANPLPVGDGLLLQEVGDLIRFSDVPARFNSWQTIQ